MSLTCLLV